MRRSINTVFLYGVIVLLCLNVSLGEVFAAVGCTLNDPDRDIRRIFPEATGFKTEFITVEEAGGEKLSKEIEERLGDKLDSVYEALDVPYAFYRVLKGKELIGRVHGVNQKGEYGGIQIILATDTEGIVVDCYYQKISSPEARKFRSKEFVGQFKGLTLLDFYKNRDMLEKDRGQSRIGKIKDPTEKSEKDFSATLRGVMKNLILLDEFKLGGKYYKLSKEGGVDDEG
jgi:hypothetical protein